MAALPTIVQYVLMGWLLAGIFLLLLGGLDVTRRERHASTGRTWTYWAASALVLPVIVTYCFAGGTWPPPPVRQNGPRPSA